MQLKRTGHPAKAAVAFCRLIHLTDRGFELQLVPPDMASKALKRGGHYGYQTQITIQIGDLVEATERARQSLGRSVQNTGRTIERL